MATTPTAQRPAQKDAPSPAKTTGDKPVASFRFGSLSAAIFAAQVKLQTGKTVTRYNVSLRKSYRTAQGEWDHTHTLGVEDLLPAGFLLTKCADFIAGLPQATSDE